MFIRRSGNHSKAQAAIAKSLATDAITAKVMVADRDLSIVYMNNAVVSLLREAEADIRTEQPNFKVDGLIGSNIDIFHKNPAHQRKLLENLTTPHRAMIQVGGRVFDLLATPLMERGERRGIVVEWADAGQRLQNLGYAAQSDAISRAQAVIEFTMDGKIVTANQNFLDTVGYALSDIKGQHHSMLVDPAERESAAYREFWSNLGRGEYQAGEYRRIGKGGKELWLLASYNPVFDDKGAPLKVVKLATDVSNQKRKFADLAGQIEAIDKSQAVIEFNLDGTILTANANFLNALGYVLGEIRGMHHSMFVEPAERDSSAYREFWANLN